MASLPPDFYAQAVGFIALIVSVFGFSIKNEIRMKRMITLSCAILGLHYALMGAVVGSAVILITGTRNLLSSFKKIPSYWAFIFMLFYLAVGFYRYESWIDALPVFSSSVSTFGLFYLSGIKMRLTLLISAACFVVYDFNVGSIGPCIMEFLILASTVKVIYALYQEQKKLSVQPA